MLWIIIIYILFIYFYLQKVESYDLQFKSTIRFTKPSQWFKVESQF